MWKPSTEVQKNHLHGMFITSEHVCGNESVSSAPGYLETCLTSPGRWLPGLPARMAPAMQSLPGCPTNSFSRHLRRPDRQPITWSPLPTPTTQLEGPKSALCTKPRWSHHPEDWFSVPRTFVSLTAASKFPPPDLRRPKPFIHIFSSYSSTGCS